MSRITCKNCGEKQGLLGDITFEGWYSCPKCGPICPSCDNTAGLLAGFAKVCPKCSKELEKIKR
jgi:hypothetical protein